MRGLPILLQKEFREAWRSWKFLWIPLVFAILGMSDPLTNYYMMDILHAVGNLPEGFDIQLPEFVPADLLQASIGQFQMIGLLVLLASFIGSISKERANGTATLLYVRSISFSAYFISKFLVISAIGFVSAVAGFAASVYYTTVLYGNFEIGTLLACFVTYFIWLLLVIAVILMMSATFNTMIAATGAFIVIFIGQFLTILWDFLPWSLPSNGVLLIRDMMYMQDYWWSMFMTVMFTIISIAIGIVMMKKNTSMVKI
ncbi:ABC transporter permease [Lysinibacillus piscis]|uniref:ABC transporter permease n=1 Tax=Lysinibacillus piscis TaxID=2518931 RepID=A0ABQ5NPN2_9BACI|nr:ABC transporter permease [Lysinibacillus sp. KH24]GLC90185.1 hypothetical protein LYSBPC_33120 [Lysinibacillus sp. KH24]